MKVKDISPEANAQRKAYYKKYRAEHREQIAKAQARYWERKAQKVREDHANAAATD